MEGCFFTHCEGLFSSHCKTQSDTLSYAFCAPTLHKRPFKIEVDCIFIGIDLEKLSITSYLPMGLLYRMGAIRMRVQTAHTNITIGHK